jgi:DNA-binding YbaB/EbfC family protein
MFDKEMLNKFQEMQQKMDEVKSKLDNIVATVEAAGGDIKITVNGNRKVLTISIIPALQHGDKEELEEQLAVAVNRAIEKADELNESEMKNAASGMLPGGLF